MLKTTRIGLGALALAAVAAAVLGTGTLRNLWRTTQAELRERAGGAVREDVELRTAIEDARNRLPKHIAASRGALKRCIDELAAATSRLAELEETAKLVGNDLAALAEAAQAGQGTTIRGKALSPAEAKTEAVRVLALHKRHQPAIRSRKALLETLKSQKVKLEQGLAAAEAAAREFSDQAKAAATKVELLRMARRAEEITRSIGSGVALGQAPEGLKALNQRLDVRLEEVDERQRLDRAASEDPYATDGRTASAMEELRKLYPPKDQPPAEKGGKGEKGEKAER